MYSRTETAQLKKSFWTSFGQYMKPVPSAEGETINWINYKTGVKNIKFKMDADTKFALIAIEIHHDDMFVRQLFFEQFEQLKSMLQNTLNEEWSWQKKWINENEKHISRISTSIDGINVLNKDHWPTIISFLKQRIIALDEFWCNAKFAFEVLQ